MYDYQAQTSLPPIRARQQRPSGVQVQQLYESSPVLATISHHPPTAHYPPHKQSHADSTTGVSGSTTAVNHSNSTINGLYNHQHYHSSTSQIPTYQPPAEQQQQQQQPRKSPSVDSMLSIQSASQQRRANILEPDTAMKMYMSKLTAYERHEIFSYPQVYFVGQNARKRQGVGGGPNNGE